VHKVLRVGLVGAIVVLLSGCWLAPNQGPDRSGHNVAEQALTPGTVATLTEQWRSEGVWGTGLLADGARVYAYGYGARALEASTGRLLWATVFDNWRQHVRGAFVDGDTVRLHVRIVDSWTQQYDAATGVFGGGSIGDGGGGVVAIRGPRELRTIGGQDPETANLVDDLKLVDRTTGTVLWEATAAVTSDWSPTEYTLGTQRIYGTGPGLLATTPGDGAQGAAVRAYPVEGPVQDCGPAESPTWACPAWVTSLDGRPVAAPVLSPDEASVYVVTDTGRAYALDAATGAPRWTADLGAYPRGEPALAEGRLYVATAGGRVLAFDTDACAAGPSPCAATWTATAGAGPLAGQPAVAGGVVVVGTAEGAVRAYAAAGCGTATCDPLWTGTVAGPVSVPPIVSNGRVLVLDDTERLTAFAPTPASTP
jgi:outer membrane protein assembly factor BamB